MSINTVFKWQLYYAKSSVLRTLIEASLLLLGNKTQVTPVEPLEKKFLYVINTTS